MSFLNFIDPISTFDDDIQKRLVKIFINNKNLRVRLNKYINDVDSLIKIITFAENNPDIKIESELLYKMIYKCNSKICNNSNWLLYKSIADIPSSVLNWDRNASYNMRIFEVGFEEKWWRNQISNEECTKLISNISNRKLVCYSQNMIDIINNSSNDFLTKACSDILSIIFQRFSKKDFLYIIGSFEDNYSNDLIWGYRDTISLIKKSLNQKEF